MLRKNKQNKTQHKETTTENEGNGEEKKDKEWNDRYPKKNERTLSETQRREKGWCVSIGQCYYLPFPPFFLKKKKRPLFHVCFCFLFFL